MQLKITIDTKEAQRVLLDYARAKLGDVNLTERDLKFEVKSDQNFRSEWEVASFRVTVEKHDA